MDHAPRPCAHCGELYRPYSHAHRYCSGPCRRVAALLAHGHTHRPRRYVGRCLHCGRSMYVRDSHMRTYCSRDCYAAAAEIALARPPRREPPLPPAPTPVRHCRVLPGGLEVEIVWHGAACIDGRRGGLLELVEHQRIAEPVGWDDPPDRSRERGTPRALRRPGMSLAEQRDRMRGPGTRR